MLPQIAKQRNYQDSSPYSRSETTGLTFIEQLAAKSHKRCPNPKAPIMRAVNEKLKITHYSKAACGMWSCPVCSAKNSQRWIAQILTGVNQHIFYNWVFVTVTAHEKTRGKSSLWNLRQGWPKLLRRYKRAVKYTPMYTMVYEPHADEKNSLHMHMIISQPVGKKWWKDNARQCGLGYQDDERVIDNAGKAAGYAAKYLLKASEHADRYPKNMRRINCSRNWPQLPELSSDEGDYVWSYVDSLEKMLWEVDLYKGRGYVVAGHEQVKRHISADLKQSLDKTDEYAYI